MSKRPLPTDLHGHILPAGSAIDGILEVSITASGFVAVTLGAANNCKSVYITTRDGANFLISNVSAGTTYSTVESGFGIDISKKSGEVLCYVKGTSTTTLEVMLLD